MLGIGVQTQNVVRDDNPYEGFSMLKRSGFDCCDFSLNGYLKNTDIYHAQINRFFDKTVEELLDFFAAHKAAAKKAGVRIHQMHMPYPIYVPGAPAQVNDYLWNQVAPKSMEICHFLECPYIVIHGFKLEKYLGSEELEWQETQKFIDTISPAAKKYGITICIENLYNSFGGHMVEGPCCDARKAAERIDRINEKYGAQVLGFCFDSGHANLLGIDFEQFVEILGDRLKVLHLHDNDGIGDLHQIPYTFTRTRENTSSTDWDGLLRGLRAIHFDKVLSFETAPVLRAFPDEMQESALAFIAEIGKYWEKCLSTLP